MEKDPFSINGIQKLVEEHKNVQAERSAGIAQKLEGILPFKREFKKEELEQVVELNRILLRVKKRIIELGLNQTDKVYESLVKTQEVIDNLGILDTKFTTGDEGKFNDKNSVYYTTPSGIALRFKMANVEKNLQHVIQPFMENITFTQYGVPTDSEFYPKQMPEIGWSPEEYLSDEFYEFQNQENITGKFLSQVKLYFKDNKLYYVERPQHLRHFHLGSPVNKIIFIR